MREYPFIEYCRRIERTCELNDGRIVHYDVCATTFEGGSNYYDADKYEYIGEGYVNTINGVKQSRFDKEHFWVKK